MNTVGFKAWVRSVVKAVGFALAIAGPMGGTAACGPECSQGQSTPPERCTCGTCMGWEDVCLDGQWKNRQCAHVSVDSGRSDAVTDAGAKSEHAVDTSHFQVGEGVRDAPDIDANTSDFD